MRLRPRSIGRRRPSRRAYTLIEFLVVVAILAVVLGLLLPAVQRARESARRLQCQNNLKQLALSCLNHEQMLARLPTGGWGIAWTGDADLGFDRRQPGGWFYTTLPFLESSGRYDMGMGLATQPKNAAHLQRLGTGWASAYYCPTRRTSCTYPWINSWSIVNAGLPKMVDRSDYAANGGDAYTSPGAPLPPLWKSALPGDEAGPASFAEGGVKGSKTQAASAKATFDAISNAANGVIFCGSMVKMADIADGAANTYLLGEKYLNPDAYLTGEDLGDNAAALVGDNDNVARWTFLPPMQDTPAYAARWRFGSAHVDGFSMAFCDGSVKLMDFAIDPKVHCEMGNRMDQPAATVAAP
jgi:prepilin-type N-terminal cleavage/methylation domain-containing protein